jgi:hypothetical protein
MIKKPKITKKITKKIIKKKVIKPKQKIKQQPEKIIDTPETIIEEHIEGKKYVMKSLKMISEFESFYSHGEACLIGQRFFGNSILY